MMKGKRIKQLEREVESLTLSLNLLGHLINKADNIEDLRSRLTDAQIGLLIGADTKVVVEDVLMARIKEGTDGY